MNIFRIIFLILMAGLSCYSQQNVIFFNGGAMSISGVAVLLSSDGGTTFSPVSGLGSLPASDGGSSYLVGNLTGGIHFNQVTGNQQDPPNFYKFRATFSDNSTETTGSYGPIWSYENFTTYNSGTLIYVPAVNYTFNAGNTPCTTNRTFTARNNTTGSRIYYIRTPGQDNHRSVQTVKAGETYQTTQNLPCDAANSYVIQSYPNVSLDGQTYSTNDVIANAGNGVLETGNGGNTTLPTPVIYDASNNGNISNSSPIIYSSSTNSILSQQQGDSAVYDAVVKFAAQNHTDLLSLKTSTNIGAGGTNVSVMNWPAGWSNSLSGIYSNTTVANSWLSQIASNTASRSNGLFTVPGSATNSTFAELSATSALGDYGIDAFIQQLNPTLPSVSSGSPDMTMQFCGHTINLDPVQRFPQVANFTMIGFTILLLLAFLLDLGRMFWDLLKLQASTSTGGVPNLEVGIGGSVLGFGGEVSGNALGVAAALLVPLAFVSLFAAAMAYLFSNIGINIAQAMDISTFEGAMGAGYYLLSSFFPVNLFFSLIMTRIVLTFTLGKLVALALTASRFLWGK